MPISRREFNSINIEIPDKVIFVSGGKVMTKPTLTKTGNLTTLEGKKSIKLEKVKGNEANIKSQGKMIELKTEKKKAKDRAERAVVDMRTPELNRQIALYTKVNKKTNVSKILRDLRKQKSSSSKSSSKKPSSVSYSVTPPPSSTTPAINVLKKIIAKEKAVDLIADQVKAKIARDEYLKMTKK
jgi:hypothetical protein